MRLLTHPLVIFVGGIAVGYMWGKSIPGINKLPAK